MSVIRKDEYILGQSIAKNLSGMAEAIRIDLALNPNPYLHAASVTGKVRNTLGTPVPDSVVLLLDKNYDTVANTISESDGSFTFSPVEAGSGYHIYAQAPGFALGESQIISLTADQMFDTDIILPPLKDDAQYIITGKVQNSHGLSINNASVELYKLNYERPQLLNLTYSNEEGQFVFQDIQTGPYQVKVNALGYFNAMVPIEVHKNINIAHVDVILTTDPKATQGVVTGLITNSEGKPLANADVILYRVGDDISLTPVAYTKTNHDGVYLFANVPQGEYRINSNRAAASQVSADLL